MKKSGHQLRSSIMSTSKPLHVENVGSNAGKPRLPRSNKVGGVEFRPLTIEVYAYVSTPRTASPSATLAVKCRGRVSHKACTEFM